MMKKSILILLVLALLLSLSACGGVKTAAEEPPAAEESLEPAVEEAAPPVHIVYWNDLPALDAALQSLAAAYAAQTGTEVEVRTIDRETYAETLSAAFDAGDAPTVFCMRGPVDLHAWGGHALDLSGAAVTAEASNESYRLYGSSGALLGLGFDEETYGLVVNTELLAKAGYTVEALNGFNSLRALSDGVHIRAGELGFDAFAPASLMGEEARELADHLLNIPLFYEFWNDGVTATPETVNGSFLPYLRLLWNLELMDSKVNTAMLIQYDEDVAMQAFFDGKAIFYPQGSWAYERLAEGMDPDQLCMIPLYCGAPGEENVGLSTGCRDYWAVNAEAPEEERQAALDFLYWMVSSADNCKTLAQGISSVPFKAAPASTNPFIMEAVARAEQGQTNLTWMFNYTPEDGLWRDAVLNALARYGMDPVDMYWTEMTATFTEAWRIACAYAQQR